MLEANEGLENIFENAVKEAEKRRHEYVTIEHVLISLVKDESIGTVLHDFKVQVGSLIKDVEDYLDTKCNDIVAKGKEAMTPRKTASPPSPPPDVPGGYLSISVSGYISK